MINLQDLSKSTFLTWQDLQECETEADRIAFIRRAIELHESSPAFKAGREAGMFYRQIDLEQEAYTKKVYDLQGFAHEDNVSPNNKLTTNFFYTFTDQMVQYLLGNGVSFDNPEIKEKLGNGFDYDLIDMLTYAACDGVSFALYTEERGIEPFCFACRIEGKEPYFIPLYDEDDGSLKAGIRYWRLAPTKPLRATLYEPGYVTEYKEFTDSDGETGLQVMEERKPYTSNTVSNDIEGVYSSTGEDSGVFPIIQMDYINGQSSMVGNKNKLHAFNMILSEYANNVDWNLLYWVLNNCDGMSTQDDINFVASIIKSHVFHLQDGVTAEPHQLQVQYEAREALLERLRRQLFFDFQAVDVERIAAGNVTTVEINAAYNSLERKCDKVEKYVSRAIQQLLVLMGYDKDEPFHFQRARERNEQEAVQTAVAKAPFIGDEATTKEILEISGKTDEFEEIQKQKAADALARMSMMGGMQNAEE